jgi:hypothetical protein
LVVGARNPAEATAIIERLRSLLLCRRLLEFSHLPVVAGILQLDLDQCLPDASESGSVREYRLLEDPNPFLGFLRLALLSAVVPTSIEKMAPQPPRGLLAEVEVGVPSYVL